MKKLLLLFAAMCSIAAANAQTKELDILRKRMEKSQATVDDPKKSGSASTWLSHADVMYSIANAYTSSLVAGLSIEQTQGMIGDADEETEEEIGGKKYQKYIYEDYDVYVNDNREVSFWTAKKELKPGAIDDSWQALKKAYELDPKEVESKGYVACSNLLNKFNTEGMNMYTMNKYAEAAKLFERSVEVSKMMGNTDSTMTYYTGVCYNEAGDYEKSLTYLQKCIEIGYTQDGGVAFYIAYTLEKLNRKDDAIKILEEAMVQFPNNKQILPQLIGLYIDTKKGPDKIIAMLDKAKESEPNNHVLYMTEGQLWEQMKESSKAQAAFQKVIELDPTNFLAYFNTGVLEARQGDAKVNAADKLDINDVKGYNKLIEEAVPFYTNAIAALEKAHELDKKNEDVIHMLKVMYFPRRDDNAKNGERFKYFDELAKSL